MKKKEKGLSTIEKVAIMVAAALPVATFILTLWNSKEVGSEVEI